MEEKQDAQEKTEIGNPAYCAYVDGSYTYKDPNTNHEFIWDETAKKWTPKSVSGGASDIRFDGENYTYTDQDGTVFEWDAVKAAWFPKGKEEKQEADLSENPTNNTLSPTLQSPTATATIGFHNPNYDSSSQQADSGPRRFYYAALSPDQMGVNNEPVLFLSPDDQANNNQITDEQAPLLPVAHPSSSSGIVSGHHHPSSSSSNPSGVVQLPTGWERHDDANGPYYWHIKSGTIQRDLPTPQQSLQTSSNPALLIPGSLQSTTFRRSQTISSQLSGSAGNTTASSVMSPTNPNPIAEKRKSWSQYLENNEDYRPPSQYQHLSSNTSSSQYHHHSQDQPPDKSLRFVAVSLGCLSISEEDLTPERSSRAVSKVIAELTNPGAKAFSSGSMEVAGKIWGGGSELFLELDDSHLRVKAKGSLTVAEQPIHSIRVWGVGRDDPRDFAYVAREKQTRQFLCHVFRLELNARPLASALRDACKKIMIERQQKQKRPTTLPTGLRRTVIPSSAPTLFPTPMDEPRKVIRAFYLGAKVVNKPTGMDVLNCAIDILRANEPVSVSVSVAPSVILITTENDNPKVTPLNLEIRVRYLSFMGIGRDVKTCGVIIHTSRDDFEAHCFYSTPSSGALCKAIEAACVLRYQLDEEFLARYQLNYGVPEGTIPLAATTSSTQPEQTTEQQNPLKRKQPPQPPQWFDIDESQNTKVYCSNLPLDITEEEFIELMGKCGLIMKDAASGKYKIKLYGDAQGNKKGDGLCTYIKVESVQLALDILDGSELRGKNIHIERAKFTLKGEYDPSKKPRQKKRKEKEKLKKAQESLFAWKPDKLRGQRGKNERVVIVANAFSKDEFDKDVSLILEFQQDFREEANKFGNCKKVVVFDRHPEGIVQIFMSNPEEADAVITSFNKRFFGGRVLAAYTWDGQTKFKVEETDTELSKRLEGWEKFIEEDEDDKNEKDDANNGDEFDEEKLEKAFAPTPPRDDEDSSDSE